MSDYDVRSLCHRWRFGWRSCRPDCRATWRTRGAGGGISPRGHLCYSRLRAEKLLVYASRFHGEFEDAVGFGWTVPHASFDWNTLIANKDKEIARLEAVYGSSVKPGVKNF